MAAKRNGYGVSAPSFAKYFAEKGGVEFVQLDPIVRQDALKELAKMDVIRRFEVRLASVTNGKAVRNPSSGVNANLNLRNQFDAPSLCITFSMNRKPGTLSVGGIVQAAKQFFKGVDDMVAEKIVITGMNPVKIQSSTC